MVVQPPPVFVTSVNSESETESGSVLHAERMAEHAVEKPVESLMSGELQVTEPKDASLADDAAKPAEPAMSDAVASPTLPPNEGPVSIGEEVSPAEETSSVIPREVGGRIAAVLATVAPIDLPKVGRLLAALPGIQACVIAAGKTVINGGDLPEGLDPQSIRELARRMHGALGKRPHVLPAGEVQHVTLHADRFSLSLFTRGEACVCAVHRARIFLPGVREKFAAVADELGRLS
jgi:hypothetical protein